MTSKITIDLDNQMKPIIKVVEPNPASDDVRDKIVKGFFENLGYESSFVGVVADPELDHYQLVPMDITHAWEWMFRALTNRAKRLGKHEEVLSLCVRISETLFRANPPRESITYEHVD